MVSHCLVQLAKEAQASIGQLVGILKAPGIFDLPGTIAVVAFRTAASIGTQRPLSWVASCPPFCLLPAVLPNLLQVRTLCAVSCFQLIPRSD